jgi:hypothetical protein
MRLPALVLAAAVVMLPLESTAAQTLPSAVGAGARVRVRVDSPPPQRTMTGTVRTLTAHTLTLAPSGGGADAHIPVAAIGKLEVSRGRGIVASHVIIGAVAGAAAGGLLAGAASSCGTDPWCRFWRSLAVLGGGGLGGVVGAGVGALVKGEKWMTVPVEHRVTLAPVARGGVGVALTVQF